MIIDVNGIEFYAPTGEKLPVENAGLLLGKVLAESALSDVAYDTGLSFIKTGTADVSDREIKQLLAELEQIPMYIIFKRPLKQYLESIISITNKN